MGEISLKLHDWTELGQSASRVSVCVSRDSRLIVRKEATQSAGASARLEKQFSKHLDAISSLRDVVRVPLLLSKFEGDSYLMEYVPAEPLGIFLTRASISRAKDIGACLAQVLDDLLSKSHPASPAAELALAGKLVSLRSSETVAMYVGVIDGLLSELPLLRILEGWNHGDFSLDNILITSQAEICLVDFLDSPAETPLLDVGRLVLDLRFGWWFLGASSSAATLLNSRVILECILRVLSKYGVSQREVDFFVSLAALRVLPYSTNPKRLAVLKRALNSMQRGAF